MYKPLFNQRKALRFRHFSRKGYALFACMGRVVTIGVLSVATLQSATAAHRHLSTDDAETADSVRTADKEATLDDVEVTGSRAPLALGQAARMVTVLSRDDIQAAPVRSINDLLKMAVGIDVRQRGPIGAQTDIGIRGSTQEQITILLNGINICDPQTGHNVVDLPCDVSDIIRIEVLEGPAARVYGTSSLVGAINIVTQDRSRKPASASSAGADAGPGSLLFRLEGGSFGLLSAAGRVAIDTPAATATAPYTLGSTLSASYTRSDGFSRSKSGELNSDYKGGKVFCQGHYTFTSLQSPVVSAVHWHAGLSTKGFGSNTFYSAKFDEQFEQTTKLFAALQGDVAVGGLHIHPSVYWNRGYDRFELIRGSESRVPYNYHRTDVFGINLNSYFDWVLGRTALGAEFRNEDIVSTNLGEALNAPFGHYKVGLNRSNLSMHLEHNVLLSHFTLSAGFIAVKNTWNEMPFTVYPGIDASYRIGHSWKIYASYNESLRMPSFTELYYSVGGHKADKYLKPEEMRAVEGGVRYSTNALTAKACIFHHHGRNMIDWVMDTREADGVWQSVNLTKVNTLGEEVSISLSPAYLIPGSLPLTSVDIAYCHQHQQKEHASYLQSQYALEYLRHKLTASLRLQLLSRLHLTLACRWQDRMGTYTDTDGHVCNYHPYCVVDSKLSWHTAGYDVYLEANNMTSKRYVDYGNVPQPGIWLTFGAKYRIGL